MKDTSILMIPGADSSIATRVLDVKANVRTVTLLAYTYGGNPVNGSYWIFLFGYIVY